MMKRMRQKLEINVAIIETRPISATKHFKLRSRLSNRAGLNEDDKQSR